MVLASALDQENGSFFLFELINLINVDKTAFQNVVSYQFRHPRLLEELILTEMRKQNLQSKAKTINHP